MTISEEDLRKFITRKALDNDWGDEDLEVCFEEGGELFVGYLVEAIHLLETTAYHEMSDMHKAAKFVQKLENYIKEPK